MGQATQPILFFDSGVGGLSVVAPTARLLPTAPIGVEYAITPLGHSLREPFEALCVWALTHGPDIEQAGTRFDHAKAER